MVLEESDQIGWLTLSLFVDALKHTQYRFSRSLVVKGQLSVFHGKIPATTDLHIVEMPKKFEIKSTVLGTQFENYSTALVETA